ncbi:MAG: hypothetical protein IJN15_02635 [Clostridia bacterium]|nr:hypothetical protein [Clostridia bacterium]
MTNSKITKRTFWGAVLSLILCVSMLVGTTFAWFTDTASTAVNSVQSGTLDIELQYQKDDGSWANAEGTTLSFKKNAAAPAGEKILWEPGCTYELPAVKVVNKGNLAVKYQIAISGIDGDAKLNEVIDWTYNNQAVLTSEGTLLADKESEPITIKGHMQETANNDYQNLTIDGIAITVYATQLAYEYDSFGNEYDAAAGTAFVGGAGTESNPYLIDAPSQLMSISEHYDEYNYYKIADGVETLDMTGIGRIDLNGSFDGNGVEIVNLSTSLFRTVGTSDTAQEIKISNFSATVRTTDGHALVRNIYNPGETVFENVELHGYIEGQYNVGSFYNYGTANAGGSDGANYTVSFVNTTSDATLVCTTGNTIGGMLGHGYEGADYQLSINMDSASGYTGNMYTNANTCYAIMGMCSHSTYILNGVETSRYDNTYTHSRITVAAPAASADGYYVAPVNNADHYIVYLNSQLTAYDENGVKISNLAGITWNLGKETITSGLDGKIFDTINSATIVNDSNDDIGYELNNGELTIYSGRDVNYASGWVTLQVNQYDANNTLLATGIITVYTFAEP